MHHPMEEEADEERTAARRDARAGGAADGKPYPLGDLRVLDLSRFVAGPFVGRLLCDLGADVVKVEPPSGDVTRLFGVVRHGLSGLYFQQNAGKRNVCIDIKQPGGVELVRTLAAGADVVVENFRPGVLAGLGLGYETLAASNPRLVMLSISGFGQQGPEAGRQAYAPIIHAESGWVARRREILGAPLEDSVVSFADSIAGLHGLVGLLSALHLRNRTGRGQHVDVSMLDAWLATDDYVHYLLDGAERLVYQGGEVWEAPGGPLMLNRPQPQVWKILQEAYGLSAEAPAGADREARRRARREAILRWMRSFDSRDGLKRALEKVDLVWGEVRTSQTVLESPTVAARGIVALVADGADGQRRVVQSPYRFSEAASGARGAAPRLGQHNAAVFEEWAGLSAAEIASLVERKVLRAEEERE
ncbi:MAG: CoA transferase [Deltaproteobacteria bacterium]|nr:CoA transferase [Deltaproteobacteria bacterium]